jgi:hypothetical protein
MILKKLVSEVKKSTCCVCESRINPYSPFNFSLSFGPKDIRRKARFCGLDCLSYFIGNLREMTELEYKESACSHGGQDHGSHMGSGHDGSSHSSKAHSTKAGGKSGSKGKI